MPSPTHQNYLLFFRNHPELVFELARRAGAPVPRKRGRLEEAQTEFDDPLLTGNTVRADLAIVEHEGPRARRGLVLEVQLDVDLEKEWTLVLYRAGLRRRYRCAAWVLWFSPEAKVRDSVHDRMFVEEPDLRPLVVTPEMIPVVRDLDVALADYPWAVLAACVHANGPDAVACTTVAIQALLRVAPEDYGRYIQLVSASVGEDVMQQAREQLPPDDEIELTEFERRGASFKRGHREGLQEGLEQGLERGLERGLEQGLERGLERGLEQGLESLRAALRAVLEARGLTMDEHTQERIAACSELDQLRDLIARAATISATRELFYM